MPRIAVFLILAISLAACSAFDTMVGGFEHAMAVESDLQAATGMTPDVGFKWTNGRLVSVTVTFPGLYNARPLSELADTVRRSVATEFKQTPENIELTFVIGNKPSPAAQLGAPPGDAQHAAL